MNLLAPLSYKKNKTEETKIEGALVGILGSKGGTGATTLAVNLATDLSRSMCRGSQVCLVDANLQQPDAALYLNSRSENTLCELLSRSANLEVQTIEACKIPVGSGHNLRLISPPVDGSAATHMNKDELSTCLPQVAKTSSITIVDLPRRLEKSLVMLLDQCHFVVLVVEPNVASIAAAKRWLEVFNDLEYSDTKIILAANRLGSKAKLLETQLSNSFERHSIFKIPNAFKAIETSQIEGVALADFNPKDPYTKAINAISLELLRRMKQSARTIDSEEE